jgi:hypothetical protein
MIAAGDCVNHPYWKWTVREHEIFGWRLASIDANKLNYGMLKLTHESDCCGFDTYVGPNLRLADPSRLQYRFIHVAGLSDPSAPGDDPKTDSRDGKDECERGNPERKKAWVFKRFLSEGFAWLVLFVPAIDGGVGLTWTGIVLWIDREEDRLPKATASG